MKMGLVVIHSFDFYEVYDQIYNSVRLKVFSERKLEVDYKGRRSRTLSRHHHACVNGDRDLTAWDFTYSFGSWMQNGDNA